MIWLCIELHLLLEIHQKLYPCEPISSSNLTSHESHQNQLHFQELQSSHNPLCYMLLDYILHKIHHGLYPTISSITRGITIPEDPVKVIPATSGLWLHLDF